MTEKWDPPFELALRHFIPSLADDAPLTPDLDLTAAGLDSIRIVQLMARLERDYGVEFALDLVNLQVFRTPASLWEAIQPSLATLPNVGSQR